MKDYFREYEIQNKEKRKEYSIKNNDKLKEYRREYYLQHKEKKKQSSREYKILNKDKQKEYDQNYYLLNREKIKHLYVQKNIERNNGIYVPSNSWTSDESIRQYFDVISPLLHISDLSDWYRISRDQIVDLKGIKISFLLLIPSLSIIFQFLSILSDSK